MSGSRTAVLLFVFVMPTAVFAAASEDADPYEQATMLHAQGIGRELEGNREEALKLLQQAAALAPTDEVINFDLARLSFELKAPSLNDDVKNFLKIRPSTKDERILRAYLLGSQGDPNAALAELQSVDKSESDSEALQLQRVLQRVNTEPVAQEPGHLLSSRVAANIEFDSNVQVLPETVTTNTKGYRLNVDGAVQWQPMRTSNSEIHLTGTLRTGTHLNNRTILKTYDTESVAVLAGGQTQQGKWLFYGDLEGSAVFISDFQDTFMKQLLLDGFATYEVAEGSHIGAYGFGGGRQFVWDNLTGPFDRTGSIGEIGLLGDVTSGEWFAQLRVGYQGEQTSGFELRERGLSALFLGRYMHGPLAVFASVGYQHRDFNQSVENRVDDRLIPTARVTWAFTPSFQAVASYAYFYNKSIPTYQYNRQLASLGVEAQW